MPNRAISILHVFPSFAIGGQQRRLATLAAGLGGRFSHQIISLDGEAGAATLFETPPVVEPLILEKSGFVSLSNLGRLRTAIAASRPDLLCTYNFGAIEAAIANRIGPRLPHVHHEDGFGHDEAAAQKGRRILARRLALGGATVVTPSQTLEKIATEIWKLKRVVRIPVGVDLDPFHQIVRRPGRPVVVGALGALRAEKNIARLIGAFATASEGMDARLVIVGDGPERASLEALAARSGADARISFAGATTNAAAALAGFDIFALSSDTEQMPTSLIEAMAAGLPVIATDVGDVAAMVPAEARDFVIAAGNEAAFVAQLRSLIENADLRARQAAANRAASSAFGRDAMIDAFRILYESIAERG